MSSNADPPGAPPQQQPAAEPLTPATLLAQLTMLRNQLMSTDAVQQVAQLDLAQRQAFVDARGRLGSQITRLQTEQLKDIRLQLDEQSAALQQGMDNLERSLNRLESVNSWAGAINGVIGLLGQIVSVAK